MIVIKKINFSEGNLCHNIYNNKIIIYIVRCFGIQNR